MSSSVKVKRNSSIELLRVISMVFIIFFHMVVYTYHMEGTIEFYSFNHFVFSFFRTGGKFGVALFSIITGYFMIRSKISFKKIILLELQVLFYTISIMFLFVIFDNHSVTKEELLKILFPNYMKTYWFFSSYFLLYLCIPILNYILLKLRQEWFLGILGVLFSIFLVLYHILVYNTIMNNVNYKSNNNIVYSCKYHVVWCPKYRRKVLVGKVETRLKEIIVETCAELSVEIIEMELMPDHVHLLLEVDPQFGIHKAVKQIKGVSSRILRQEFKELRTKLPTLWTNSYFVSTVGGAPLEVIKQYIESQKTSQRQETPTRKRKKKS